MRDGNYTIRIATTSASLAMQAVLSESDRTPDYKQHSPNTICKRKHGPIHVPSKRAQHSPLDEVDKVHLAIHAARNGRIEIGHVSHARNCARVRLHRAISFEVDCFASVLKTYNAVSRHEAGN